MKIKLLIISLLVLFVIGCKYPPEKYMWKEGDIVCMKLNKARGMIIGNYLDNTFIIRFENLEVNMGVKYFEIVRRIAELSGRVN
jgi:hypothetical protein